MRKLRRLSNGLLWLHLSVCLAWLYVIRTQGPVPEWLAHVILCSVLGVQFSWGFTVGLIIGPARKRRSLLWASLLLVFMPLWPVGLFLRVIAWWAGPLVAGAYVLIAAAALASETYCGVLLGARLHSAMRYPG